MNSDIRSAIPAILVRPQTAFDPFSPSYVADPYAAFSELRDAPVFYSTRVEAWIVLSYAAIVEALGDQQRRFSAQNSIRTDSDYPQEVQAVLKNGYALVRGPVNSDGEVHQWLRGQVRQVVNNAWMMALAPTIRQIAHERAATLAARLQDEPEVDLVSAFADLPLAVMCDAFGIERGDMGDIKRWSSAWALFTSGPMLPLAQMEGLAHGLLEFQMYMASLLDRRRHSPGGDVLSRLLSVSYQQRNLADEELLTIGMQLLFAGAETVATFLPSLFLTLLQQDRGAYWRVAVSAMREQGSDLLNRIIDEALRYNGPVLGMFRWTTADVELAGVAIPAHSAVQLMYAAGNHDPLVFPDPQRFDPMRANASHHLSFGWNEHFCLGAPLGRLESRIVIEVMAELLPDLRLARPQGPVIYRPNAVMRGLDQLLVTLV